MNFSIGTLTTANPWLWVNTTNFEDYRVSSASPGDEWFQVNQFCSILAVTWLQAPSDEYFGFRQLSAAAQLTDAQTLQGFTSPDDQAEWAATQLGGEQIAVADLVAQLPTYGAGTQIWMGNDRHTLAALVRLEGKVTVVDLYNPDTGMTETYQVNQLATLIEAWNINVAVVKNA